MPLTGNQIRAARVLLGWKQEELRDKAGVGINSIRNKEACGPGMLTGRASVNQAIQHALEKAGVEFIPENGGGVGVRLKKKQPRRR